MPRLDGTIELSSEAARVVMNLPAFTVRGRTLWGLQSQRMGSKSHLLGSPTTHTHAPITLALIH